MKVLTVLVPTYNVEKYLRRCLDSLLLPEVFEEIEVLVVNDGSKDGSADIARAYEKKYPQTVVFVDKENGGHGSTINVGIEKAQGTYFKVLDSDDWVNIGDFIEFVKRLKEDAPGGGRGAADNGLRDPHRLARRALPASTVSPAGGV